MNTKKKVSGRDSEEEINKHGMFPVFQAWALMKRTIIKIINAAVMFQLIDRKHITFGL